MAFKPVTGVCVLVSRRSFFNGSPMAPSPMSLVARLLTSALQVLRRRLILDLGIALGKLSLL
jgi:hypothetical protein